MFPHFKNREKDRDVLLFLLITDKPIFAFFLTVHRHKIILMRKIQNYVQKVLYHLENDGFWRERHPIFWPLFLCPLISLRAFELIHYFLVILYAIMSSKNHFKAVELFH
jgi:hypothetical protein